MCNGEAEVESLAYGWIWIHVGQDLKKKKADVAGGERKLSANMEALKKQFAEGTRKEAWFEDWLRKRNSGFRVGVREQVENSPWHS